MPFYMFICDGCQRVEPPKLMTRKDADGFSGGCICGHALRIIMGTPTTQAKETVDEHRDKTVIADVERKLDDRAMQHFREHDLPRIIADHGREFAKQHGLIDEDGSPKQ